MAVSGDLEADGSACSSSDTERVWGCNVYGAKVRKGSPEQCLPCHIWPLQISGDAETKRTAMIRESIWPAINQCRRDGQDCRG